MTLNFKAWLLFTAGPIFLLLGILSASVWFAARKVPADQIPLRVTSLAPHLLLAALLGLALLLLLVFPSVRVAWRFELSAKTAVDATFGACAGIALAYLYLHALAPALEAVQRQVGDYVPPGSVLPTVSSHIAIFFVANVLLAPLVEETLYRGLALPALIERFGAAPGILVSCLLFGLLHWPGGFWYMVLTATAVGGLFTGLTLWRGSLVAPFAAHLALNLVEFLHARSRSD